MRIGYSFWGFLGPGIVDTPDGGRSHRRILIDGMISRGHDVVFLQTNRDLHEAGQDLTREYLFDMGTPEIDVLFCEWRWPIPGRNTIPCGVPEHSCDLHRQEALINHYTLTCGTPTIIWDKDRQLPVSDSMRRRVNVTVCEPALYPTRGATSLLFPVPDEVLDHAEPDTLAAIPRPLALAYVGNQYDRDQAFDTFFAPAAAAHAHLVAGKWGRIAGWPHVNFTGRVAFPSVQTIYQQALTTLLLLPDRYNAVGHVTQRLFEAVLAGCLPLTPTTLRGASRISPLELHVANGADAAARIRDLQNIAETTEHTALIAACLRRLDVFRLSRQLDTVDQTLLAMTRTAAGT